MISAGSTLFLNEYVPCSKKKGSIKCWVAFVPRNENKGDRDGLEERRGDRLVERGWLVGWLGDAPLSIVPAWPPVFFSLLPFHRRLGFC